MSMVALADLVGDDEPLDPASMRFTVKAAKSCRGCLFAGQRASVCHQAAAAAQRSGLPDYDLGNIFIELPIDPRQLTID